MGRVLWPYRWMLAGCYLIAGALLFMPDDPQNTPTWQIVLYFGVLWVGWVCWQTPPDDDGDATDDPLDDSPCTR